MPRTLAGPENHKMANVYWVLTMGYVLFYVCYMYYATYMYHVT